jgi:hypothetical protein
MKCVYCGQEYDEMSVFHDCQQSYHVTVERPAPIQFECESFVFVLRDILEELKKFNEREQRKEQRKEWK